ncbi:hypothetical protein J2W48_003744 [Flavobacterium piscis]|uniref:DUF805 domain-containing protein n=1 Tax=Flavobacterium piscis TaxID=1114874 RepID=A0ABU1YC08_9FLAO|nr:hypothetical protein [Flavobacterium piscis]
MIIRKLTDPIFIHFSKMYIHFYQDRKRYWRIFPSLILATIFTLNLETLSFFIMPVSSFYYVCMALFFAVMFLLLYNNIKYEYIKDYKMSSKIRVIITLLIIVDLVINFILTSMLRDEKLQRMIFL